MGATRTDKNISYGGVTEKEEERDQVSKDDGEQVTPYKVLTFFYKF
jgi:hypothetical protein